MCTCDDNKTVSYTVAKMAKSKKIFLGYATIILLGISILGMSISVWAKPYNSSRDTAKAIVESVVDTSHSLIITDNFQDVFEESNQVDTMAINTVFLQKMREKGELLSSNEFASRITDYYNTLVAVLTALFVLFSIVTYMTIKNKFEEKFEDKANELEAKQRQKIVDELRSMLNDSKKIDEVIKSAVGGHVEDQIATKEEIDGLTTSMETYGKNITSLTTKLEDVKKKQQELFKVVSELQEQIAEKVTIHQEVGADDMLEKDAKQDVNSAKSDDETSPLKEDSEYNTTK